MSNKIQMGFLGGLVATAGMSIFMMITGMLGMPKMSPPEMLSGMMGFSIVIGWIMHFAIGIFFAMIYSFLFRNWLKKVSNSVLKGVIFGIAVFIFAQIMLTVMGAIFPMPPQEGSIVLIVLGSLLGHIVFGTVVALIVKRPDLPNF